MHAGNTTHTGPNSFLNTFFNAGSGSGGDNHHGSVASSPLRSANIQITPPEQPDQDKDTKTIELDAEQRASAAILAQEEEDDVFESAGIPPSMSASFAPESVSVSPAAMFLSAFSSPPVTTAALPDAEGRVISGYTLGTIIGYGAFSTIRRASSTSGGIVAVKIVRRSDLFKQGNADLARKRVRREGSVWATLSHEHVLPLFSVEHTTYADYFFTLYCPAGSLFDILKRDGRPALPQDDVGMMFRQVVRGLRYLHEVAVSVHRDMKLENVLVDEMGVCRIGDFGMTRKIGEIDEEEDEVTQDQNQEAANGLHRAVSLIVPKKQARSSLQAQVARHNGGRYRHSTPSPCPAHPAHIIQPGSLPYASPELLLPQGTGPLLPHPAQDIWALGVLLYGLLMGRLPFADSFEPRLQMKILNGVYEVPPDIGRGAERVLKGCLERSAHSRWTIGMVDEVAWGIGWGAEGDDVTPAESDEEFEMVRTPLKSPSRSRSRHPEWQQQQQQQQDERRSRPSLEAASRRSSSRIKRSISRAPVMTSRSSSGRGVLGRHSRAASPSFPSMLSGNKGSALHISLERGRRPRKAHDDDDDSLSPSPSAIPTTPTDTSPTFSPALLRDPSRGRRLFAHSPQGDATSDLDVLDETADWPPPATAPATHASKRSLSATMPRLHHPRIPHQVGWKLHDRSHSKPTVDRAEAYFHKKRPGSSPPASVSFWSLASANGIRRFGPAPQPPPPPPPPSRAPRDGFRANFRLPSALEGMTRSRSLEFDRRSDAVYLH